VAARAWVGCSGWQYRDWKGRFYPEDLPQARWLEHYATVFDTVEINNSFYRLPTREAMIAWRSRVPMRFIYAVKASRYLTHMRKLKDPRDPLDLLFDRARLLGRHLGPVLYQLPPGWKPDFERLATFLAALPRDVRQTIEFRGAEWYTPEVLDALERRRVALCLHDMPGSTPPRLAIGPFVYIRFHGATGKYAGCYSDEQLDEWASWIAAQIEEGRDAYAYFNNDREGHAVRNALTLRRQIEEKIHASTPVHRSGRDRQRGRGAVPRPAGAAPPPRH
jgi:uncharacterized protein YecE (DUF72 family)